MPTQTAPQIIIGWFAFLVSAAFAFAAYRRLLSDPFLERKRSAWSLFRRLAVPIGIASLSLRSLLIGYGVATIYDPVSRFLLSCATFGIAGGIAASRIRRRPH